MRSGSPACPSGCGVITVGQGFVRAGDRVRPVPEEALGDGPSPAAGGHLVNRLIDASLRARADGPPGADPGADRRRPGLSWRSRRKPIPTSRSRSSTSPMTHDGISPEDAERLLVRPMEQELRSIEGVKEMRAQASEGEASVTLEFEAGVDIDKALADVREKVDIAKADLPDDTDEPIVNEVNLALFPVLVVTLSGDRAGAHAAGARARPRGADRGPGRRPRRRDRRRARGAARGRSSTRCWSRATTCSSRTC